MEKGNNKIINFAQDYSFYLSRSKKEYSLGNFSKAISFALSSLPRAKSEQLPEICFELSKYYKQMHMAEPSLYYSYLCIKSIFQNDSLLAKAYDNIGSIFYENGNNMQAKYYYELVLQCPAVENELEKTAREVLKEIKKENFSRKSQIITSNNSIGANIGHRFFMERDFKCAIEAYEKHSDLSDPTVRSQLVLSYVSCGDNIDKAKEIIEKYGTDTTDDLCVGLVVYQLLGDKEKYYKTRKKINPNKIEPHNLFKVAVFLVTTTVDGTFDYQLALSVMEKSFDYGIMTVDFQYLYALTLLSAGQTDNAKEQFINLKSYDKFNEGLYDYYLNKIFIKAPKRHYMFSFDLPRELRNNLTAIFALAMQKEDDELFKFFNEHKSQFYLMSRFDLARYLPLLKALCNVNDKEVTKFVDYILFSSHVNDDIKKYILINQATSQTYISLAKNGIYTSFKLLGNKLAGKVGLSNYENFYMKLLSQKNHTLHESILVSLDYFLGKDFVSKIDFSLLQNHVVLNFTYEDNELIPLSCFLITILYKLNSYSRESLSDVLTNFKLSKEDFDAFIHKYGLEI